MRVILSLLLGAGLLFPAAARAQDPDVIPGLKKAAEAKGNVSRSAEGTFYFKWLPQPVRSFEKAYFRLSELPKGKHYLTLGLMKKTPGGVVLTIMTDPHLDGTPDEAYVGAGKTLAEADRAIAARPEMSKGAITPELRQCFKEAMEDLRWELGLRQ